MKSGGGVGSRTPIAVSPKARTWQFKTTSSASVKYKYLWMSFHNDRPLSCGACGNCGSRTHTTGDCYRYIKQKNKDR